MALRVCATVWHSRISRSCMYKGPKRAIQQEQNVLIHLGTVVLCCRKVVFGTPHRHLGDLGDETNKSRPTLYIFLEKKNVCFLNNANLGEIFLMGLTSTSLSGPWKPLNKKLLQVSLHFRHQDEANSITQCSQIIQTQWPTWLHVAYETARDRASAWIKRMVSAWGLMLEGERPDLHQQSQQRCFTPHQLECLARLPNFTLVCVSHWCSLCNGQDEYRAELLQSHKTSTVPKAHAAIATEKQVQQHKTQPCLSEFLVEVSFQWSLSAVYFFEKLKTGRVLVGLNHNQLCEKLRDLTGQIVSWR